MEKQAKIDLIYETIAHKTLSNGCIIMHKESGWFTKIIHTRWFEYELWWVQYIKNKFDDIPLDIHSEESERFLEKRKIIWHPVMIWDVLDYLENYFPIIYVNDIRDIMLEWEDKRKPIEEQSDECIDYIYSVSMLVISSFE